MKKKNNKAIRLRCFVAIAFGREDTDAIYDTHIKRAIEESNMTPVRVDRVTYLDRVDAKIRKEIRGADIIISDLTYARPSVYWEAGYAERSSPVIYTCRDDHFKQRSDDQFGNFAIHFDLKNANIIRWRKVGDRSFHKKLKEMLIFAAKPIRVKREEIEKIKKARFSFSQRSLSEKRRTISLTSTHEILQAGYKARTKADWQTVRLERSARHFDIPLYGKKIGSTLIFLDLFPCFAKLIKRELEWYPIASTLFNDRAIDWLELPNDIQKLTRRKIRSVRRVSIIPVINNVPINRIEDVTQVWRRIEPYKHYYHPYLQKPSRARQQVIPTNSSREFVIFDKILSADDYEKSISGFLNKIQDEKETLIPISEQSIERY